MTTVPILNKANFEDVLLWTPDLPEQRAIAAVLRTVQQTKEACEKVIAATRALKQSLLHQLFTYGPVPFDQADRVALKETEIGMVPEHWKVKLLGELIEKPDYGVTASATEDRVGPRFLRITDIQGGGVNWAAVPYCVCSPQDARKKALQAGDILVARIGATTGKTFLVDYAPDAVFASYLIRVRSKPKVTAAFLSAFTETELYWHQIDAAKGGRLKHGVNIPVLQHLLVPTRTCGTAANRLATFHRASQARRRGEAPRGARQPFSIAPAQPDDRPHAGESFV